MGLSSRRGGGGELAKGLGRAVSPVAMILEVFEYNVDYLVSVKRRLLSSRVDWIAGAIGSWLGVLIGGYQNSRENKIRSEGVVFEMRNTQTTRTPKDKCKWISQCNPSQGTADKV